MEITANEASRIRTACGLKDFDADGRQVPVPREVALDYAQIKRCFARLSGTMELDLLIAFVAAKNGYGVARPTEDWNAATEWNAGRLRFDDRVAVMWKGKPIAARAKMCKSKTMRVQFDGDAGERDVPVNIVLPFDPSLDPKELVGGNA